MKLSEELQWRGFVAEHTFKSITDLDERTHKFYLGVDPSASSMTIGNLAALMMCRVFIRHGYEPTLLVGGATGRIGDPKENEERTLKAASEVDANAAAIRDQFCSIVGADVPMVNNYDWFRDIKFLDFLREVGKQFSMTQLLDREFVKNRIGEGGSGISLAEFCYSTIQGYDFLHLFRTHDIDLQLCGADQFGNCVSGLHLIKRLEDAEADVWSTPLVIDPVTGRKFGKSEGNAIWLSSSLTSIFDFYQFWLGQPDDSVEYLAKIYTDYDKPTLDDIIARHAADPSARIAQRALAEGATTIVHGPEAAKSVVKITTVLYGKTPVSDLSESDLTLLSDFIPALKTGVTPVDALVSSKIAASKSEARTLLSSGAISINGEKITQDSPINSLAILKKGKNKFILVE